MLERNMTRLVGLAVAFIGCILVFFTSSKVKSEAATMACLIGGGAAIIYGLKLMIE